MGEIINQLSLQSLANFHFMRPFWLLAILPLAFFCRQLSKKDNTLAQWQGVMSKNMVEHLTVNPDGRRKVTPKKAFTLFAFIATVVMAGPTWKQETSPLFEDNSELIIALDVSMQGQDLAPSRLVRAKQKISQLLEMRGDARSGLIIFGGSAHVAMPVTKDRALAAYFLDALEPNLLPEKTSKPDAVLKPIDKLLSQSKAPSTVLIVTDKTEPEAIEAFEQKFKDLKHQVVVWAIGESGLSQSELTQLETLAKSGNGSLVQFTHDDSDVKSVNSEIENNLFAVQDNDQPWHDSGYWLLFLILPIQLMWFRRGWTLQW